MSDVNSYKLVFKGLSSGKHTVTFEMDDSFFSLFEGSEIEHGKLSAEVIVDKQSTLLQLDVKIHGNVKTVCDRCLDDLDMPIDYAGQLLVKFGKGSSENDTNDEVVFLDPAAGEINLSQFFFDSINVTLPLQRMHKEGMCNKEMINKLKQLSIN
jgi:uncharacterized metal-binding protein YceD (DUF177 family)